MYAVHDCNFNEFPAKDTKDYTPYVYGSGHDLKRRKASKCQEGVHLGTYANWTHLLRCACGVKRKNNSPQSVLYSMLAL